MRNDVCDTEGPLKKEEECRKVNNKDEMRLIQKKKRKNKTSFVNHAWQRNARTLLGKTVSY